MAKVNSYNFLLAEPAGDKYYSIGDDDLKWVLFSYGALLDYLFNILKEDLSFKLKQATELDKVRLWICKQLQLIQNSIEFAYVNVMERENMRKNLYFQNNIKGY